MRWSRKYDCCVECRGTDDKHKGRGLCVRCYRVRYFRENPEYRNSRRYAARVRQWREANPDRSRAWSRKYQSKFKKERGVTTGSKWFRGVEVKDSLFGIGTVQAKARRVGIGEWEVPVKFGDAVLDMPTRELTRTGFWE